MSGSCIDCEGTPQSISAIPAFLHKSHEELRWQDHKRGNNIGHNFGGAGTCNGTNTSSIFGPPSRFGFSPFTFGPPLTSGSSSSPLFASDFGSSPFASGSCFSPFTFGPPLASGSGSSPLFASGSGSSPFASGSGFSPFTFGPPLASGSDSSPLFASGSGSSPLFASGSGSSPFFTSGSSSSPFFASGSGTSPFASGSGSSPFFASGSASSPFFASGSGSSPFFTSGSSSSQFFASGSGTSPFASGSGSSPFFASGSGSSPFPSGSGSSPFASGFGSISTLPDHMPLSVSASPFYSDKSHEELRLEYYHLQSKGIQSRNTFTGTPWLGQFACSGRGCSGNTSIRTEEQTPISISATSKSHEELRWDNYQFQKKSAAGIDTKSTFTPSFTPAKFSSNLFTSNPFACQIDNDSRHREPVNVFSSSFPSQPNFPQIPTPPQSQSSCRPFAFFGQHLAPDILFSEKVGGISTQLEEPVSSSVMPAYIDKSLEELNLDCDHVQGKDEKTTNGGAMSSTKFSKDPNIEQNYDPNQKNPNEAIPKEDGSDIFLLLPKLGISSGYYTEPGIKELEAKERAEPGFCSRVKNFLVGKHGFGSITFLGETDVRNLDIEAHIKFNDGQVSICMDETQKPEIGEGLNKPAEISILNLKCIDPKTGEEYLNGPKVDKYRELLRKKAAEVSAEFVSYEPVRGEWKFRVSHF